MDTRISDFKRAEIETIYSWMINSNTIIKKLEAAKTNMEKKPEEAQMMKEKERSEFQQSELNAPEDQMREEMLHPVKEKDEVEKMLQSDKDSLKSQCEEKRRNMEKEQDRYVLRLREIQTREAQMIKKKEDMVKEKDVIERRLQVDKDSLVLQLNEKTRHMKKEKERHKLQLRLSETREAQMKKEIEDVEKKKDEIKRRFQAERHSLVLKLEEQTSIMCKEKKRLDLQQIELKAKERQMQEESETLVKEREAVFSKLILEKNRSVLQLKENIRNMEKEKGGSHLQQQESEARKDQMREDMKMLLKEIDEMCRRCSVSTASLELQFETETRELEENDQPELQQHETEAREAQTRKDVEMLKEVDKMWRTCQISTESLGLQLEKETKGFEKEKVQFKLQQQKDKARQAQMRDEMEALGKLRDKIKILQADKDSLVFQLVMEKERCEEMERSQRLVGRDWMEQCKILGEKFHENEKILEEMIIEVQALKGTKETLRQKARKVKCKWLKNFIHQWLQKLWKKKNITIKIRQNLDKVRKILEEKILEMTEENDDSE